MKRNRTKRCDGKQSEISEAERSWLVIGRNLFQVLAGTSNNHTEICCGFLQPLEANVRLALIYRTLAAVGREERVSGTWK